MRTIGVVSRCGRSVAIVATALVVASCGGGDPGGSDGSDEQVVERVAAACELLTSDPIVEQYAALVGGPVEPIGECVSVRPGTRQLATATTVGSGFVLDATFGGVDENGHRLRLVGLHIPWIETINGVATPADLREAFPDDEVSDETTEAGNPYQLVRPVDDLAGDVRPLVDAVVDGLTS
jgi:hypothetical protein